MKVLQINSVCGVGSTGRIATDIHARLRENGHVSYIAYGRDSPENCEKTIKIGTRFDSYSHIALTRIYDKHGFGSKKATMEFIEKVEKIDPDLIQLHNIHGYYINIELLFNYIKKSNKPVIWTLHDCWAFTGHCAHFETINCDKWKTGCNRCPQKKSYPSSFILDNSRENYLKKKEIFTGVKNMTIVTPSNWLANLVKKSFLSEYSVKVINNGINLNIFKPTKSDFRKKYQLEEKFIILGVAGVWTKNKGFNHFLELANSLDLDEVIVLVGLSEEQQKKLPKNVIGIPKTKNIGNLSELYSAANVFVNPTLEDTFPTTNLEALACGTPVITFNTGGSGESITEKCGIVVEKGNIKILKESIKNIKEGKVSDDDCIQHSKLFDKNERFSEYIDLYSKVNN